ncbi:MAG TPA: hypothetical protein VFH17_03225, partial [Coriobacteriia bacterium]|nr:hypothetical protein [Coriobacteriia bacterium]
MARLSLPQDCKLVTATAGPVTTNGGVTCDYVSLKNVIRAWIVLQFTQAVGHATAIQPQKATAVAPTGAASITNVVRVWADEDTGASDALVAQTDATSYTVAADIKKKMVVIEIDPIDLGGDHDVLGCTIANSGQATNFVSGLYILQMGYRRAT